MLIKLEDAELQLLQKSDKLEEAKKAAKQKEEPELTGDEESDDECPTVTLFPIESTDMAEFDNSTFLLCGVALCRHWLLQNIGV